MPNSSSTFQIPAFSRAKKTYDFDAPKKGEQSLVIYEELNAIAEELEKCRLKNS